jgi:thiamine biosynthesis lipoprotein
MGMLIQLVVTDPRRLSEARRLLEEDLARVDQACSRFRPDSELVALARTGRGGRMKTVQISPILAEAIAVSLGAAELTEGDVDPTVGTAMSIAGYDRDFELVPQHGPPVKIAVHAVPGWRQITLDEAKLLLTIPTGVELDLGATAKAWAADRSAARIAAILGCGALVSLGGDIALSGRPPEGGWRVRVQDVTGLPQDQPDGPSEVVAIQEGGLATSSTKARRWQRGGEAFHHILNPRTGLPAAPVWRTVSVAAATCVAANTASTAAVIRGEGAFAWLARLGLPARLVDASGTVYTTGGWPAEAEPAVWPQEALPTTQRQFRGISERRLHAVGESK